MQKTRLSREYCVSQLTYQPKYEREKPSNSYGAFGTFVPIDP